MPRPSFDREAIETEIDRVRSLGLDETTYASLSTIARAITGTSWNGPRFFGLHSGAEPRASSEAPTPNNKRMDLPRKSGEFSLDER